MDRSALLGLVAGAALGIAMAVVPVLFPHMPPLVAGILFYGGILVFMVCLVLILRRRRNMDDKKPHVTGMKVENEGGGTGMDLFSQGAGLDPAHVVSVVGQPGQSVTGLHVRQMGLGTGMRVTQVGPGTGLHVRVVIGDDDEKKA